MAPTGLPLPLPQDRILMSLGFERRLLEHVVYKRNTKTWSLLVGVYVDDLVILESKSVEIAKFTV